MDQIGTCWPRSSGGDLVERPCPEYVNGVKYNTTPRKESAEHRQPPEEKKYCKIQVDQRNYVPGTSKEQTCYSYSLMHSLYKLVHQKRCQKLQLQGKSDM
ncbi:hypothetical protein L345_13869, partial [Ophiophagus hannah]